MFQGYQIVIDVVLFIVIVHLIIRLDYLTYKERVDRNNADNQIERKLKKALDTRSRTLHLHVHDAGKILPLKGLGKGALIPGGEHHDLNQ